MEAVGIFIPVILIGLWVLMGLRIINEYENGVVLRLGLLLRITMLLILICIYELRQNYI